MGKPYRDALVEDAVRTLRRRTCTLIAVFAPMFAILVIGYMATWVGVVGGGSALLAAVLAVASLVADRREQAVERAWLAVGLTVFSVALAIVAGAVS